LAAGAALPPPSPPPPSPPLSPLHAASSANAASKSDHLSRRVLISRRLTDFSQSVTWRAVSTHFPNVYCLARSTYRRPWRTLVNGFARELSASAFSSRLSCLPTPTIARVSSVRVLPGEAHPMSCRIKFDAAPREGLNMAAGADCRGSAVRPSPGLSCCNITQTSSNETRRLRPGSVVAQ
jgi:hypothetical protein